MSHLRGIAVAAAAILLPGVMIMALNGPALALFSQYLGISALIAMALSHIIATRAKVVEIVFGPLDRAYVLHKWLGILALASILLHDSIDAEIKQPGTISAFSDLAEGMGEQSLNGLLILIAITLITIIPYRIWYWTHRAMGACFVLGALHFAMIVKPFSLTDLPGLYTLGFCVAGTVSYAWTLLPRKWKPGHCYRVSGITRTANAIAVEMAPESHPLRHTPGQFAFFSFGESGFSSETHPFTLSSAPRDDGSIRITIAAAGDFTNRLEEVLHAGMKVRVHGPYGRFRPLRGQKPQVWIAAGVGITPFLSVLESMSAQGPEVDLLYTYRGRSKAPHLEDIRLLAADNPRLRLHLHDTSTAPRLNSDTVSALMKGTQARISFCGPTRLLQDLRADKRLPRIHAEAFELRTGIPLPSHLRKTCRSAVTRFLSHLSQRSGRTFT